MPGGRNLSEHFVLQSDDQRREGGGNGASFRALFVVPALASSPTPGDPVNE